MYTKDLRPAQKAVLVCTILLIWATYAIPYTKYWYDPVLFSPGVIVWETYSVQHEYAEPPFWSIILGKPSKYYFDAEGFVPFWNTVDKEVDWPRVNLQAVLLALASLLLLIRLQPQSRREASPSDEPPLTDTPRTQAEQYDCFMWHTPQPHAGERVVPRRLNPSLKQKYAHGPRI